MSKWDKLLTTEYVLYQKTSGLMNYVRYWKAMDM